MFLLYFYTLFSYQTSWQVFLYVYKWLHVHSMAVYICKEGYLILLFETEDDCWPKFTKLDSLPRCDQECCFLLSDGEYIYVWGEVGEGLRNDSGLYI